MNVAVPPPPPPPPPVLPVRIGPFDRVTINDIPYGNAKVIVGVGYSLCRLDVSPPLVEDFSHDQLAKERNKPGYAFDRDWFAPEKAEVRQRTSIERLADLHDHELPVVMWKLEWVTRFMKHEDAGTANRTDDSMLALRPIIYAEIAEMAIAKIHTPDRKRKPQAGTEIKLRLPPCVRRWRDWINDYEEAGCNPCVLRDNRRNSGNREPQITAKVAVMIVQFAVKFAALNRPKKKHLHKDLCDAIDDLPENVKAKAEGKKPPFEHPSLKTFSKAIKKLDKYDVYAGRYGVLAAKRKFAMVAAGLDVTRPFQRIEIDEWQVSLMVLLIDSGLWEFLSPEQQAAVERVRMWICAAIDCATRCIVGMRLSRTPSSANVMATLRMMVSDKSVYATAVGAVTPWDMHGSPEQVASDSGPSFIADITQGAIIDLTGAPKIPPVDLTYMRGRIERLFGTVHTVLVSRLHGRTFENTVALGDYKPEAMANLTVDEIAWMFPRFAVDIYHNLPHAGLGGETPRNAWLRLTKEFGVNEPPDRDKIRAIFGTRLKRTIRKGGIHVLGLNYNSEYLEAYRRRIGDEEIVDVRLDHEDIGFVSVRVDEEWLTVPCVQSGFERISVKVWTDTLADLRRRYTREAEIAEPIVREAIRAIQRMSENAIVRAGIGAYIETAEDIERAERDLAISFAWAKPEPEAGATDDQGDLFSRAFPASGDAKPAADPEPTAPPQSSPNAAPPKFRMED
jgi:putative transposase